MGCRASSANCASLFSGGATGALGGLEGDERPLLPDLAGVRGGVPLDEVDTRLADVLCMMLGPLCLLREGECAG